MRNESEGRTDNGRERTEQLEGTRDWELGSCAWERAAQRESGSSASCTGTNTGKGECEGDVEASRLKLRTAGIASHYPPPDIFDINPALALSCMSVRTRSVHRHTQIQSWYYRVGNEDDRSIGVESASSNVYHKNYFSHSAARAVTFRGGVNLW